MNHRFLFRAVAFTVPLFAALSSVPRDACALGPADVEVAGMLGGGTTPSHFGTNPLGVGIGGRAGVSAYGLYGGVSVIDYLGSTTTTSVLNAETVTNKVHALLYGVDAGLGVKIVMLKLRAQVGVGDMDLTGNGAASGVVSVAQSSNTNNYLYVQPGILAELKFGLLLVGADVNVLMIPSGPNATASNPSARGSFDDAIAAHAQLGVSF